MVENVEVIVVHVVASKDIGDEARDFSLSNTSLSNKSDCVWCLRLVLCSAIDMVMTPFLRDSTLLLKTIRTTANLLCDLLDRRGVGLIVKVRTLCQDIPAWVSNSVGGYRGEALVAGRATRVVVIKRWNDAGALVSP